ncbi:MAG: hypothetical protein RSE17_01905 [Bacilli bacterium]
MKKILIYGDSNTWGDNFITGKRIPDDKQWPNILQSELGDCYKIIQEGLPGRIAGNEENEKKFKNGKDSFMSIFRSQAPVDIIIFSLGTNDLQLKYNKTEVKIIDDLLWYKKSIENEFEDIDNKKKFFINNKMPRIIYILPANFDFLVNASCIFDSSSEEKRLEIIKYFECNKTNVEYISLNNMNLFLDGVHLDYDGHSKLAEIVKEII